MAVILRTAGADRSRAEIKRDYEYLQRTWNNIREVTMQSRAPALIHEEASLIKRSIRDIYSRDIEEVWVEGEEGYKTAKDFMRMLTPSHARKVQRYKDDLIPLFHRYQVESQMETINSPMVQLRSGGSIVFNQTEALVAIDVNSGRARVNGILRRPLTRPTSKPPRKSPSATPARSGGPGCHRLHRHGRQPQQPRG